MEPWAPCAICDCPAMTHDHGGCTRCVGACFWSGNTFLWETGYQETVSNPVPVGFS